MSQEDHASAPSETQDPARVVLQMPPDEVDENGVEDEGRRREKNKKNTNDDCCYACGVDMGDCVLCCCYSGPRDRVNEDNDDGCCARGLMGCIGGLMESIWGLLSCDWLDCGNSGGGDCECCDCGDCDCGCFD